MFTTIGTKIKSLITNEEFIVCRKPKNRYLGMDKCGIALRDKSGECLFLVEENYYLFVEV